jgi:D-tyrosyl-tRNA(Tyr) deacylase
MRALVQRVAWAKVEVEGELVGAIERGLLVYLGAGKGDGDGERAYVLQKVLGLRIFEDGAGKMNLGVSDVDGALLVVSQFTLYGDVRRGRRPSFDDAMPPEEAERAYDAFVREARGSIRVETGRFRAHMRVTSLNEGPVTLWIDSAARGRPEQSAGESA